MAGSKEGGSNLVKTAIRKHGSYEAWRAWMRQIAAKGGKNGTTGGFFKNRALAREAGRKGGSKGKRSRNV